MIWVCSQAGNVLILLSPSSLLDSLLIAAKTTIAVLLLGLAGTLPGQLLALVLVVLALRLFPRALRLVVFGTLVSQDLVRHRLLGRPVPSPAADRPVRCFTSCRLGGLPLLTCGRLGVQDGALAFSWRPLMVGRERTRADHHRPGHLYPRPRLSLTGGVLAGHRGSGAGAAVPPAAGRSRPPRPGGRPTRGAGPGGDLGPFPAGRGLALVPVAVRAGSGHQGGKRRKRAEPQPSRATGRRRRTESAANRAVPAQTRVAATNRSRAESQSNRHNRSNSSQATAQEAA